MKYPLTLSAFAATALTYLVMPTFAQQEELRPRPVFMPSTPAATKEVAAYTTHELVGAVITNSIQYPVSHPYRVTKLSGIKNTWPGSSNNMKIDEMVQIVLDAPATSNRIQIRVSFENVRFIIQEVMNVNEAEKADAFVRIVAAQTDPLKSKRAKQFARAMFEELLDVRLLAYEKEALDDATEYTEPFKMAEGRPPRKSTIRKDAKLSLLFTLNSTLKMNVDETPFDTNNEAADCNALKTWLTANWTQIANKCAALKADPNRVKPMVNISPWDARW